MPSEPLIGYLTLIEKPSEDCFYEAYISVDERGYPLDYGYTDKIQVSSIQRHLYGETLRHFISNEVCGTKLIDEVEFKPTIILVNNRYLLELRTKVNIPVLYVDSEHTKKKGIDSFVPHPDFKDDLDNVKKIIESCTKNFEIIEPFDRISKAIENMS